MIELKLDTDTLFEWQKHSQSDLAYEQLLSFIDLRAKASETSCSAHKKSFAQKPHMKLSSHIASAESENKCVACKTERHPLYLCAKFKTMSHDQLCRANRVCTNCLGVGHFKTQCKSVHRCKTCQRAYHTLLHRESAPVKVDTEPPAPSQAVVTVVLLPQPCARISYS